MILPIISKVCLGEKKTIILIGCTASIVVHSQVITKIENLKNGMEIN